MVEPAIPLKSPISSHNFNPISPHNDTGVKGTGQIKISVTLDELYDDEEITSFDVCIYSQVKVQVVHDRTDNTLHVLRNSFK